MHLVYRLLSRFLPASFSASFLCSLNLVLKALPVSRFTDVDLVQLLHGDDGTYSLNHFLTQLCNIQSTIISLPFKEFVHSIFNVIIQLSNETKFMKIYVCVGEILLIEQNRILKIATLPTFWGGEFKERGHDHAVGPDSVMFIHVYISRKYNYASKPPCAFDSPKVFNFVLFPFFYFTFWRNF